MLFRLVKEKNTIVLFFKILQKNLTKIHIHITETGKYRFLRIYFTIVSYCVVMVVKVQFIL